MTIGIFALKGELNGNILLVLFFFHTHCKGRATSTKELVADPFACAFILQSNEICLNSVSFSLWYIYTDRMF